MALGRVLTVKYAQALIQLLLGLAGHSPSLCQDVLKDSAESV